MMDMDEKEEIFEQCIVGYYCHYCDNSTMVIMNTALISHQNRLKTSWEQTGTEGEEMCAS